MLCMFNFSNLRWRTLKFLFTIQFTRSLQTLVWSYRSQVCFLKMIKFRKDKEKKTFTSRECLKFNTLLGLELNGAQRFKWTIAIANYGCTTHTTLSLFLSILWANANVCLCFLTIFYFLLCRLCATLLHQTVNNNFAL